MSLLFFTMENHEEILDALTAFGKNPNPQEIPSVLEQYLNSVAKNGETLFPWTQLKPLILRKMELVIMELRRNLASENIPTRPNVENVRFDVIHARIIDSLHKFNGAPFTIQRLCELLIDPKRHYKRSDKFMRGLEKNVLVVSTVDPFGRKVVSELGNKPVLNGILDINGSFPPRDSALSVPLPPVPGWVNTSAVNRNMNTGAPTMPSNMINKAGTDNNLDTLDKDPDGVVSNSLSVSGTQVFSDQGDPLSVQSEEVVEETVVTMDTGEVSSVVTDGGESLAEREIEADIGEDRDASSFSSSSSSSSSEELSTSSDSIENGLRRSTSPLGMAGTGLNEVTAMDENRPWAAFAQHQDDLGTATSQSNIEENQISGVSSSSPHNTLTADTSPSSSCLTSSSSSVTSETQSSLLSTSTTITSKVEECEQDDEKSDGNVTDQQTTTSSDQSIWKQSQSDEAPAVDSNQSFGFDPVVTSPQQITDMTKSTATDKLISSSTSTVIPTTTSTTNNASSDVHTSSSSTSSSLSANDGGVVVTQPPTYAQVVASSTTDRMSSSPSIQHISHYDPVTEPVPACDSVAGLERLVGSVEPSLSSSSSIYSLSSASSPPSSPQTSLLTTTSQNNSSAVTTSSLPESSLMSMSSTSQTIPSSSQCCSSEDGEPVTKRLRLSVDEEQMEDDCITTSGDSCMEEGQPILEEEHQQQNKEESSSTVHSSSADSDEQPQERVAPADDVQMEEEGGVTTGTTLAMEDENKECRAESQSTSVESDVDIHDAEKSDATTDQNDNIDSNDEPSTVSTTDSANQETAHVEDKE